MPPADNGPATAALDEYRLLQTAAVVVDRSARSRWKFTGPKAAEVLNGLVTNDVGALQPGGGLYAAALTAKGKIIADVRVLMIGDSYLVDTDAAAAEGWAGMVRKFVNPRLAPYKDVSDELLDIGVFGRDAGTTVASFVERPREEIEQLVPHAHLSAGEITVVRTADVGTVRGYDVFGPQAERARILASLAEAGARAVDTAVLEVARIEAGMPAWGIDMDDTTLAQEANLDELGAVSFSKGCYVGQEVVARLHFRGHVNKYFRRVSFNAEPAPARGATLADDSGKNVGEMRSVAVSPTTGGVGIAMVRREIPAGARLTASWDGGSAEVVVQNEKGATT